MSRPEQTCPRCHKKFVPANSWKRTFCSHSCAAFARNAERARQDEERFWGKVDKRGPAECWPWLGACGPHKRGQFWINKKLKKASHFSWKAEHGEWPPRGMNVLHKCDNPNCVNPSHLFLGTQMDNVRDMISKKRGRSPHGRSCHSSRLTETEVLSIRSDGRPVPVLAKTYGISDTSIRKIIDRRSWKHV